MAIRKLVLVGEEVNNCNFLASLLGCKIAFFYEIFGFSIGVPFKVCVIWDRVVEKLERRLVGWKQLYLSKGGRLTLVKSILSNLPTDF